MIPKGIEDRIRARAYEIWQYRQENQLFITIDRLGQEKPITAEDDWIEASNEVLKEEMKSWE